MKSASVSVCIPTHNARPFLRETLRSVLDQTCPPTEIIISDDASTDDTLAIVDEMRDDRFTVLRHDTNLGAEQNWNVACSASSGEHLKLLCQDDVLLPTCLEIQSEALKANPGSVFTWSPRDVVTPRGRRLLRSRGYRPTRSVVTLDDVLVELVRSGTNPFGEPCAVLMRRSAFDATTGFHGRYLIDLNMWIDLLGLGPAVFVGETLSQFRISTTSWTARLRHEHARQLVDLHTDLLRRYPQIIDEADVGLGAKEAQRLQFQRSILIASLGFLRI